MRCLSDFGLHAFLLSLVAVVELQIKHIASRKVCCGVTKGASDIPLCSYPQRIIL